MSDGVGPVHWARFGAKGPAIGLLQGLNKAHDFSERLPYQPTSRLHYREMSSEKLGRGTVR